MSSLGIHDMNQSINGTIPLPILSGEWSEWDHAADVMKTYYLLRICLQPSLTECDLQLKWINDRSYSIKVQWPIYMRQQLMMKDLDTDFPEGHRVYDSMGKNSKALKKKDGDIWLEGVFYFKNPMNCSKMVEKLFRPKIDANNNKGPVLLIQFEEQGKEGATAEFKSPTLEMAGQIHFSKSTTAPAAAPAPAPAAPIAPVAAATAAFNRLQPSFNWKQTPMTKLTIFHIMRVKHTRFRF